MKKHLFFVILTYFAVLSLSIAQTQGTKNAGGDALTQKIIDHSRATWEAYKNRNVSAIKEYAAEDYASFGLTGPSNLKLDLAGINDKSLVVESYTIEDPKVTMATK